MSDLRHQLERLRQRQPVPPVAFDRLVALRGRRERNRRIAASVVGGSVALLLVAAAVFEWNDLHRATSTVLSPATVSRLHRTWSASVGPHASAPVVADGRVFVAAGGRLSVFDVACEAAPRCAPVWTAPLPSDATPSEPALGDGLVVVSAGDLFAFDEGCRNGGGTCSPVWRAHAPPPQPEGTVGFSAPLIAGGTVYVGASDGLNAYAERCGSGGEICSPLWVGRGRSGAAAPVASGSTIVVGSHLQLSAYSTSCAGRACDPLWRTPMPEGNSNAVVAADGLLYVQNVGLPGRCGPGACEAVRTLIPDSSTSQDLGAATLGPVTPGDGRIYASASRVYAFPATCAPSGRCEPIWRGPHAVDAPIGGLWAWSQPTVADGLVFSSTDRIWAFGQTCATGGNVCPALWTSPSMDGLVISRVAFSGSSVFVTTVGGTLVTFGLR